jgi:hypothetical protein
MTTPGNPPSPLFDWWCFFRPLCLPLTSSAARSVPLSRSDEAERALAGALLWLLPGTGPPACAVRDRVAANRMLQTVNPFSFLGPPS